MSGMYVEGSMTENARRQDAQDKYFNAIRNFSPAQVALVEKWMLTAEEEKEINVSGVLAHAREKFLEYRPYREHIERHLPPYL